MATPTANQLHAARELANIEVGAACVRILDENELGAGSDGALSGSFDLIGHLLRCCGINGLRAVAFFPKGSGGDAFNVCTDEYAHGLPP